MKKLRFLSPKAQSYLILIYMASASLYLNTRIAKLTYWLIEPESNLTKGLTVLLGLFVFVLFCAFAGGVFVKKDEAPR